MKENTYCCGSNTSPESIEQVSEETKIRQTIRNQYADIALGKNTLSKDKEVRIGEALITKSAINSMVTIG